MPTWHTQIDWTAHWTAGSMVGGTLRMHIEPAELAEHLLEQLAPAGASIVTTPDNLDRWGAALTLDAGTVRQAADAALAAVTAAARSVGQTRVTVLALDVVDDAGLQHRLEQPDVPDLVGYAGASEIGGVSRARARQLALEHGDHPRPYLESEHGPLYVRELVEAFYARPRRGGRPRKPQETQSVDAGNNG